MCALHAKLMLITCQACDFMPINFRFWFFQWILNHFVWFFHSYRHHVKRQYNMWKFIFFSSFVTIVPPLLFFLSFCHGCKQLPAKWLIVGMGTAPNQPLLLLYFLYILPKIFEKRKAVKTMCLLINKLIVASLCDNRHTVPGTRYELRGKQKNRGTLIIPVQLPVVPS